MRKVLCEWNQEEIDELATETCEWNMKEKTKAFYKAVFKYWLHERKESVKRLFVRRTK